MDPRRLVPVLAKVTAALVVVTVAVVGWRAWVPAGGDDVRRPAATSLARAGAAAHVLADWDARRARAWARGDTAALDRLYVAGSRAGEADVRLLGRYVARGLRVTGLQTQVLDLDVLEQDDRRLHLVLTDRVVGGVAVGRGTEVRLPVGRPSTRHVVLVREGDTWLVDRVSAGAAARPGAARPGATQPSAAASTSRTSRSSKS